MNVVVVGSGSWGTALAIKSVLAGNTTTLYIVQILLPVLKGLISFSWLRHLYMYVLV